MTQEQIIAGLKEILAPIVKNQNALNKLNLDSNILADLGLDSIGLIYAMMQFEKKFNIQLGNIKPGMFKTVRDFVEYVSKQK